MQSSRGCAPTYNVPVLPGRCTVSDIILERFVSYLVPAGLQYGGQFTGARSAGLCSCLASTSPFAVRTATSSRKFSSSKDAKTLFRALFQVSSLFSQWDIPTTWITDLIQLDAITFVCSWISVPSISTLNHLLSYVMACLLEIVKETVEWRFGVKLVRLPHSRPAVALFDIVFIVKGHDFGLRSGNGSVLVGSFYPLLLWSIKQLHIPFSQRKARGQQETAEWGSWLAVGGFKSVTFTSKRHGLIRLNIAHRPFIRRPSSSRPHEWYIYHVTYRAHIFLVILVIKTLVPREPVCNGAWILGYELFWRFPNNPKCSLRNWCVREIARLSVQRACLAVWTMRNTFLIHTISLGYFPKCIFFYVKIMPSSARGRICSRKALSICFERRCTRIIEQPSGRERPTSRILRNVVYKGRQN